MLGNRSLATALAAFACIAAAPRTALGADPPASPYAVYVEDEEAGVETERRSTAMMVAGIVLTSTSVVEIGVGGLFLLQGIAQSGHGGGDKTSIGLALTAVGDVSLSAGIPLWAVGGASVPRASSATAPVLRVGPGTLSFQMCF